MTPGWLSWEPMVPRLLVVVVAGLALALIVFAAVRRRGGRRPWLLRAGMVVGAALAVLGPHAGHGSPTYQQRPETQVIVALDATASMAVGDQSGSSRWQQAVADLTALAEVHDASFALVTWGSDARLAVPSTTDSGALGRTVGAMETEQPVEGVGSRLDRPLAVLTRVISQATAQHPERATFLLLLSDGENTASGAQRTFAPLAPRLSGGLVLGYGSEAGGVVPLEPGAASGVVPDPSTGQPAVSRREPENLEEVAAQLGVRYRGREDVGTVAEVAAALEPAPRAVVGARSPRDVTWFLGLVLLALAAVELRATSRSLRELRGLRRRS